MRKAGASPVNPEQLGRPTGTRTPEADRRAAAAAAPLISTKTLLWGAAIPQPPAPPLLTPTPPIRSRKLGIWELQVTLHMISSHWHLQLWQLGSGGEISNQPG